MITVHSTEPNTDCCPRCGQIWGEPAGKTTDAQVEAAAHSYLRRMFHNDFGRISDDHRDAIRAALAAAQALDTREQFYHTRYEEGFANGELRGFAAAIEAAADKVLNQPGYMPPGERAAAIRALRPAETAESGDEVDDRPTKANMRGAEMLKRLYPTKDVIETARQAYNAVMVEAAGKSNSESFPDAWQRKAIKAAIEAVFPLPPSASEPAGAPAVRERAHAITTEWWNALGREKELQLSDVKDLADYIVHGVDPAGAPSDLKTEIRVAISDVWSQGPEAIIEAIAPLMALLQQSKK